MKRDSRQRLFEVMGKLDTTFKYKLNEGNDVESPTEYSNPEDNKIPQTSDNPQGDNKLKEFLKSQLNILDWDSQEGQQKRQQIADSAMRVATEIENAVKSSISGPEKAAKVQTVISGFGIASTLLGIWKLISNTHRETYGIFEKISNWLGGGDPLTNHWVWGGTFWLKLAAFLLILKFIHKFLYKGSVLQNDIKGIWNYIKNVINVVTGKANVATGKEKMQESLMSIDEQKIIREMLAYNIP